MPVDILASIFFEGPQVVPGWDYIKKYGPVLLTLGGLKYYFGGASNSWERDMHGKVYMITGGTSGLGASLAYELASKGAQIILLSKSTKDSWLVEFIDDLREKTDNFMIYAEECDLSSLYSVRKFATKWLDNQPPRRLDGVICCAADAIPFGKKRQATQDGVERQIGINYLGHYHLLALLGPCLRSQPPDRDVRIAIATCSSQSIGDIDLDDLLWESRRYPSRSPLKVYGTSKLLLGLFAKEYQRQIDCYERKDKAPCNVKINMVNPGVMRTPSTRRYISMGSIIGLFIYLLLLPIWFLFLKSPRQGAQSFLFVLSAPIIAKIGGGNLVQECKILQRTRTEYQDEELQKSIFQKTEELILSIEKKSAIERKKLEKLRELQASREQKRKEKEEESAKRRANIYEKPESPEELEAKLSILRKLIGVLSNSGVHEPPLFPGENTVESDTSGTNSQNKVKPKKLKSSKKGSSKKN